MEKGYKRQSKGLAVLRCFVGLFIIAVIALTAYYVLNKDYRDRIDDDTVVRAYVEATETPEPVETVQAVVATSTPAPTASPTPTPAPTEEPTPEPTAEPTPVPTFTPEPTATPLPTPEPTRIPKKVYAKQMTQAQMKKQKITIPAQSINAGVVGLTYGMRSAANNNNVVTVRGFAYLNNNTFDGENCIVYLTMVGTSTGIQRLVRPTKVNGISGLPHSNALCANATASDFEANIYVGKYKDDTYQLGVILEYTNVLGEKTRDFFVLDGSTLTVMNGKAINDINTVDTDDPFGTTIDLTAADTSADETEDYADDLDAAEADEPVVMG